MNAKYSCHTITEPGNALVLEEFLDSPLKTNGEHNGISWPNQQRTARLNPELEEIEDANVAVFSAVPALWHAPCLSRVVPVGRYGQAIIIRVVDFVGTGIGVANCNQGTFLVD